MHPNKNRSETNQVEQKISKKLINAAAAAAVVVVVAAAAVRAVAIMKLLS